MGGGSPLIQVASQAMLPAGLVDYANSNKERNKSMSQISLSVPDISCAHCEKTVRTALQDRPGVRSVEVDIPAKTVFLDYDETAFSLDRVKEVLDEEGYPVAGTGEGGQKRSFIPLSSH